jgi:hypothetical protein
MAFRERNRLQSDILQWSGQPQLLAAFSLPPDRCAAMLCPFPYCCCTGGARRLQPPTLLPDARTTCLLTYLRAGFCLAAAVQVVHAGCSRMQRSKLPGLSLPLGQQSAAAGVGLVVHAALVQEVVAGLVSVLVQLFCTSRVA